MAARCGGVLHPVGLFELVLGENPFIKHHEGKAEHLGKAAPRLPSTGFESRSADSW